MMSDPQLPITKSKVNSISLQIAWKVSIFVCCSILVFSLSTIRSEGRKMSSSELRLDTQKNVHETSESTMSLRNLVKGVGTYRLAVFGSSNAWGAGLENRYDAYPYRISPEVVNYADYSAGPNYPATCLNTILGDGTTFDVFIIDFWLKGPQGLKELAIGIRNRYPNAVILFFKLWTPIMARRQPYRGSSDEMNLYEWKTSMGFPHANYETTKKAIQLDDGYWYFPNYVEADSVFETTMKQVGGIQFELPKMPTAKQTLIDYLGYFEETYHEHLSTIGHEAVATTMKAILTEQYNILLASGKNVNEVHPWNAGDACHLWYTSGTCPFVHSLNWGMLKFDFLHKKYALHLEDDGWIDIENKFDDDRTLYLSFLSTDENWYPKTIVEYQIGDIGRGGDPPVVVSVELNPATAQDTHHVHITKTLPVGKIPPGITRIYLKPKEMAYLPFRLIGASLTNEQSVPLMYGFGTTYNS